jgi:hypothetical protein
MFKKPRESETYTNHDQRRETETPSNLLFATCYTDIAKWIWTYKSNQEKWFLFCCHHENGSCCDNQQVPSNIFYNLHAVTCFLRDLNVLFEHNFQTHNPFISLILQESQHIKLQTIKRIKTYLVYLTTIDNP